MSKNLLEFLDSEGIFVNGPKYRGAPMPISIQSAINVGDFEDENRIKYFDCEVNIPDNLVSIEWLSQEYAHSYELAKREIKRYFKYMKDKYGYDDTIKVKVHIHDRDGIGRCKFTFRI